MCLAWKDERNSGKNLKKTNNFILNDIYLVQFHEEHAVILLSTLGCSGQEHFKASKIV